MKAQKGGDGDSSVPASSINSRTMTSTSAAGGSIIVSHINWGGLSLNSGLSFPKEGQSASSAVGIDHIFCSRGGDAESGAVINTGIGIFVFPAVNWAPCGGPPLPLSNILADEYFVNAYSEMSSTDQVDSETMGFCW